MTGPNATTTDSARPVASLAQPAPALNRVPVTRTIELEEAGTHTAAGSGVLESVLNATDAVLKQPSGNLDRFLESQSLEDGLRRWVGNDAARRGLTTRQAWQLQLARDIATLDEMINSQLNAILHHPQFQQIEASWRGLKYLVSQTDPDENTQVWMLNASWQDLAKDVTGALEFDQTQLFKKIYEERFGTAGGHPFGLLLGDYHIRHVTSESHRIDDLEVVRSLAQVAAASFAPFIAGAHPALFGIDSFSELERPMSLHRAFEQLEYVNWNSLRKIEDARFVGLALPRVLMRLPYEDESTRTDSFRFREDINGPDQSKYLWGNATYAFGAVALRAFTDSGWLAEIRGVKRGEAGGGLVADLPSCSFGTDKSGIAIKSSTEIIISDELEKELSDLGFIPLSHCKDTPYSAFYSNQSIQKPKTYDEPAVTMNAKISSMLQYMLCSSRIAHYLKILARQKIGSFTDAYELEDFLQRWVNDYVAPDAEAPADVKAKYPLREAQIRVRERPGTAGVFACEMHLLPHYQLDALTASVKLATELKPSRSTGG